MRTEAFVGSFPPGAYTFPSDPTEFGVGIPVPPFMTWLGYEMDRNALYEQEAVIEVVIQLSHDGGVTWPPYPPTDLTPSETDFCQVRWGRTVTQPVPDRNLSAECTFGRPTGATTRARVRMDVVAATVNGPLELTWR